MNMNQLIAIAAATVPGLIAIVGGLIAFGQLRQRVFDLERNVVNVLNNQQSVRQIEIKVTSVEELAKRQNNDISKLQERLDEVLDMLIEVKVAQARHKQE
tara:strand:- start:470 stop:769 length:300 start_codon:yes stop_codon:yes gene_type:complete